jgi:hypothetical protein
VAEAVTFWDMTIFCLFVCLVGWLVGWLVVIFTFNLIPTSFSVAENVAMNFELLDKRLLVDISLVFRWYPVLTSAK